MGFACVGSYPGIEGSWLASPGVGVGVVGVGVAGAWLDGAGGSESLCAAIGSAAPAATASMTEKRTARTYRRQVESWGDAGTMTV